VPSQTQRRTEAARNAPSDELSDFIAKFSPAIASLAEAVLDRMRKRLPGAFELVYDNYNALAIGFGPSERTSEAIFSIALYPRWVTLFFLQGANLKDPRKLLKGSGKRVRHIVLASDGALDEPGIQALMAQALKSAVVPIDPAGHGRLVIKSVSKKQRPRLPKK
jgi:Domain of unknown function (DU1801)